MILQFKKKHIGFSMSFLMYQSISNYFDLILEIKTKLAGGTYGLEDLISINISPNRLIDLYNYLGGLPERSAALLNADMKATLIPQIGALAQSGDADAATVIEALTLIDNTAATSRDTTINNGLNWLTNA